jgi:hypothetical protein
MIMPNEESEEFVRKLEILRREIDIGPRQSVVNSQIVAWR